MSDSNKHKQDQTTAVNNFHQQLKKYEMVFILGPFAICLNAYTGLWYDIISFVPAGNTACNDCKSSSSLWVYASFNLCFLTCSKATKSSTVALAKKISFYNTRYSIPFWLVVMRKRTAISKPVKSKDNTHTYQYIK